MAEELTLRWARLESWHAVPDDTHTLCGIDLGEQDPVEWRDEPVRVTEKSCENCLRILAEKTAR